MRLVVFDIDDTLTQSFAVDGQLYTRSLAEVFGFCGVDSDWSRYKHTTDSGIFLEVFETHALRSPTDTEAATFRTHFVSLIEAAAERTPFREVLGASQLLRHLTASPGQAVALATGAWSNSARAKMHSAGMCFDNYPVACADDAISREEITRLAIDRAAKLHSVQRFTSIVYVGDGIWDARTCRNLGVPFVGVGCRAHADRLLAEGALAVFPDFTDRESFMSALQRAVNAA